MSEVREKVLRVIGKSPNRGVMHETIRSFLNAIGMKEIELNLILRQLLEDGVIEEHEGRYRPGRNWQLAMVGQGGKMVSVGKYKYNGVNFIQSQE